MYTSIYLFIYGTDMKCGRSRERGLQRCNRDDAKRYVNTDAVCLTVTLHHGSRIVVWFRFVCVFNSTGIFHCFVVTRPRYIECMVETITRKHVDYVGMVPLTLYKYRCDYNPSKKSHVPLFAVVD